MKNRMELKEIEERLTEIPVLLEKLKAEHNQLLGYRQALLDAEENLKDKKGEN